MYDKIVDIKTAVRVIKRLEEKNLTNQLQVQFKEVEGKPDDFKEVLPLIDE